MAKKKRRTELDIDDDIFAGDEEPASPPKEEPKPAEPEPEETLLSEEELALKRGRLIKFASIGGGLFLVAAIVVWGTLTLLGEEEKVIEPIAKVEEEPPPPPPLPKDTSDEKPIPATYSLEPFMIPVGAKNNERYANIELSVVMSGQEVAEEIERNLVLIRENIYSLLSKHTESDFDDKAKRKKIGIEVAIAINRSIQSGAVMETLFSSALIR